MSLARGSPRSWIQPDFHLTTVLVSLNNVSMDFTMQDKKFCLFQSEIISRVISFYKKPDVVVYWIIRVNDEWFKPVYKARRDFKQAYKAKKFLSNTWKSGAKKLLELKSFMKSFSPRTFFHSHFSLNLLWFRVNIYLVINSVVSFTVKKKLRS